MAKQNSVNTLSCNDGVPFKMEGYDAQKGKFTDGHNLYLSTNKDKLEVKLYVIDTTSETLVCDRDISTDFVGLEILVQNNVHNLFFTPPNNFKDGVTCAANNFKIKVNGNHYFIGTDDVRQGFIFDYRFNSKIDIKYENGKILIRHPRY